MVRVVSIVLNNFKNDSRVLKEAISLKNNGYDVTVLALFEEPLLEYEDVSSIAVHRIRLKSRGWSKKKYIQIFKYVEFIFRVIKGYRKADIFHCNDLNTLPIGVIVKLFFNRGAKIVYDAHEYETEINGVHGIEKKLKIWLERILIKSADKVITVSDSIANEYHRLYSIPKPALVLNCPSYAEVAKQDLFRKELGIRQEQRIFLYQGGLSVGRGIEILLEAFVSLDSDKMVIVFMGYGSLQENIQKYADKFSNIFFREAVSPHVLLNYTASADYGILFYEDTCLNHRFCSPNKMFEYLMAGIPVLISNLFEMRRLVEAHGLGIVAEKNTVQGFLDAVYQSLEQDYSTTVANVHKARKIFNWEAQEKVLLDVYNEL